MLYFATTQCIKTSETVIKINKYPIWHRISSAVTLRSMCEGQYPILSHPANQTTSFSRPPLRRTGARKVYRRAPMWSGTTFSCSPSTQGSTKKIYSVLINLIDMIFPTRIGTSKPVIPDTRIIVVITVPISAPVSLEYAASRANCPPSPYSCPSEKA